MSNFEIGDTVRLKSGGPLMTVHNIGDYTQSAGLNPGLLCVWFDNSKRVEQVFHPKTVDLERDDG
ncbi:MAG: YodC family protein [Betaproteobacteria bacterium]|nr:YodC family protein [Betaproteobacteria bacterium]